MANDKTHKRPKYSLEFKQDAARLMLEKGYSQRPIIWAHRKVPWDAGYEQNASLRPTNRRQKSLAGIWPIMRN
ncbi:hypothetical protein [Methylomonas denitrificans]|uniref:Transposase n=1 Tax=Methylomonas denitrificans TaxID=1538553 RepID=A0A126T696_9GAMM|nr:hypothetical protein [Methylomonas denitrificans]AMK77274.1 hypothetical protein JT25_012430 [Methylomonas denitrificans]